jgi:hypothetical protein
MTLSAVTFFILLSVYMNNPTNLAIFGILSMIPYYICWFIGMAFYIFISPGLMDPGNKIPFY